MIETLLSNMIFPSADRMKQQLLYYRCSASAYNDCHGLHVCEGSTTRFDTYFNAFFYSKYIKYCHLMSLRCCLSVSGEAIIRLICCHTHKKYKIIDEVRSNGTNQQVIFTLNDLIELPNDGMIYFEVDALSPTVIHKGWFETDQKPTRNINLAVVICTYKREQYVSSNLARLNEDILNNANSPIIGNIDIIIVDNGNTLPSFNTEHVRIIPNNNLGGSGGFTRGLLEAYQEKGKYTHVLFMDDDISFESEIFVRTIQILKYTPTTGYPFWIGGQMLVEDQPTIQFESGAYYRKGKLCPVNQGLDLSLQENLLINSLEKNVDYNAWWFCCFPVSCVDDHGLPLPLFIKEDDVEYGLRMKPDILLMNGIGIWHMSFARKYNPYLEYYIKRNELIVAALHYSGNGSFLCLRKLIKSFGKAVLSKDFKILYFTVKGYQDFLKGPSFLLETDGSKLNDEILSKSRHDLSTKEKLLYIVKLINVTFSILFCYGKVQTDYKSALGKLTGVDFWNNYLKTNSIECEEE